MPEDAILKCAECTRRDKPCVDMSWEATERLEDRTREELSVEERRCDELLEQLSVVQARMTRKRKMLEQAQKRADEQTKCLVREMEEGGKNMTRWTMTDVLDAFMLKAQLNDIDWRAFDLILAGDGAGSAADLPASEGHSF